MSMEHRCGARVRVDAKADVWLRRQRIGRCRVNDVSRWGMGIVPDERAWAALGDREFVEIVARGAPRDSERLHLEGIVCHASPRRLGVMFTSEVRHLPEDIARLADRGASRTS